MPRDFNLLGTTLRGLERSACFELKHLLEQIGGPSAEIRKSGIRGLIAARTVLDESQAVKSLREILVERPYEFRYLLRIIPIQTIVTTDLKAIADKSGELSSKIAKDETFRVTVEKRFTTLHTREIVEAVAANIKRRVDLERPDKILLVEVVGGTTGISVIKPEEIISVMKEKML
jgi:tRNA acetyltransferase TAN1